MKGDQLYRGEKPKFNLARLKAGGEEFEVVVHPEAAMELKSGKNVDLKDIVLSEKIFSDAHKGLAASENIIKSTFKTTDTDEIIKTIIKKGEIQLTSEYREHLRDQKLKSIIQIIHRNGIDPRTNLPHPPQRIENAIEEAKVRIDEHKKAEDQIQEVLKGIRKVLPIKFETRELEIKIPAQYAPKAYQTVKSHGRILQDEWLNDGSLLIRMETPAGMQQELYEALNKITQGNCEIKTKAK